MRFTCVSKRTRCELDIRILARDVTFGNCLWVLKEEKMLKVHTIKILMDADFTSDLAHFLYNIGGAQSNIGVLGHSQRDIKFPL